MRILSLFLVIIFFVPGCSDDGGSTPAGDGPQVQGDGGPWDGPQVPGDGTPPAGDKGVTTKDGGGGPDINVPAGCVKECVEFYDWLCVKDPVSGFCKSCLNDGHCQNNPRADGPFCDTTAMLCVCKQTSDCAASTTGLKCLTVGNYKMCTCDTDADCPAPYTICEGQLVKRCVKPCTSSADCVKGGFQGTCDTSTGVCTYPDV